MLFRAQLIPGLADGTVTCALRRWRRPTVRAGGTLRSAVGVLAIDAVEIVTPDEVSEDDARAAGYPNRAAALADVGASSIGTSLYRIRFHRAGPDPRIALRGRDELSEDESEQLRARLDRFDARSRRGPWTRATLRLIAARPGERAVELAVAAGCDVPRFKADVRKLKELGLTESLTVGYRLSPRGEALLAGLAGRDAGGRDADGDVDGRDADGREADSREADSRDGA